MNGDLLVTLSFADPGLVSASAATVNPAAYIVSSSCCTMS